MIGLRVLEGDGSAVSLGTEDGRPLVELAGDPDAPPRPRMSTGLFHLALLLPDRAELARSVRRVVGAGWRFTGASDHFVSEALYLDDPEGNGIELYRDRPRSEWVREGGELKIGTVALDLDDLMAQEPGGDDAGMPPQTTMGHVHLNVADLDDTEAFYAGLLGLDVTARGYPGALFLSAGGYHHHLGTNLWRGAGAPPPPPGSVGLREFSFRLPSGGAVAEVRDRLVAAGLEPQESGGALRVLDPSRNAVVLAPPT
ncbi:MAG: Glyoxalase family protein [uncultured Solirubrobacteraceae bacterium]|uniref:Glyoxalase family protein n=1 Tax=uncultured Solirubrobacteraceae bacterium TaxID=1162706 RepID=A0A6J4T292_9ACTN|nr:MAG: Glyoxalase family protein [uncultured Solirubrobacteraceae bacterium]